MAAARLQQRQRRRGENRIGGNIECGGEIEAKMKHGVAARGASASE